MTTEFPPLDDVWFLTGPTASGKTRVGVALAQKIGAEIVSLDSMAVYRGMDLGTAKPTAAERMGVPHHLIDLVEPSEDFSIAEYLTAAHACAAEIRSRGREVLFVGGTPLYLKALLRGLTSGPEADSQLRQRLAAEADRAGPAALHARLAAIDSDAAAKIHPHDARRIIRALEVYEATGQPISASQEHFSDASQAATKRVFVLDWPRATLHRRINERVEAMFAAGLEAEVRRLRASAGGLGRTAAQAVGYREVQMYLRGTWDLSAAIERTKARTRQFARRQLIWFRALPECRWIRVDEPFDAGRLASQILDGAPHATNAEMAIRFPAGSSMVADLKDFKAEGSIATLTPTVAHLFAVVAPNLAAEPPLERVVQWQQRVLGGEPIERCLVFCPDALGCHIWQVCQDCIATIDAFANICVPVSSVVPPKTPVCFASIFTGGQPIDHGIRKYERPVLTCETLFDVLVRAKKKIAIIAVADSSVDLIFRDREIDYFSERYDAEVLDRAVATVAENRHDLVVVYQQEYDDLLHETQPFSDRCIRAVNNHVTSFATVAGAAKESWRGQKYAVVFAPDHGAHLDLASGHGDHGVDIPEDMDLLHWYGIYS